MFSDLGIRCTFCTPALPASLAALGCAVGRRVLAGWLGLVIREAQALLDILGPHGKGGNYYVKGDLALKITLNIFNNRIWHLFICTVARIVARFVLSYTLCPHSVWHTAGT